jgi:hypothetical protein
MKTAVKIIALPFWLFIGFIPCVLPYGATRALVWIYIQYPFVGLIYRIYNQFCNIENRLLVWSKLSEKKEASDFQTISEWISSFKTIRKLEYDSVNEVYNVIGLIRIIGTVIIYATSFVLPYIIYLIIKYYAN